MARPRQFDREAVLETAKAVFWERGYEATSTDDLRHAMGIGRQSLYDSFGGKRPLYLEVLQRYNADSVGTHLRRLRTARSPMAGIRDMLLALAEEPADKRALGCMGVAAVCSFDSSDPDVAEIGRVSAETLQAALEEALRKAKAAGEARKSLDVSTGAHFLQATMTGMKVSAKAGTGPAMLRDIALTALEALVAV